MRLSAPMRVPRLSRAAQTGDYHSKDFAARTRRKQPWVEHSQNHVSRPPSSSPRHHDGSGARQIHFHARSRGRNRASSRNVLRQTTGHPWCILLA